MPLLHQCKALKPYMFDRLLITKLTSVIVNLSGQDVAVFVGLDGGQIGVKEPGRSGLSLTAKIALNDWIDGL